MKRKMALTFTFLLAVACYIFAQQTDPESDFQASASIGMNELVEIQGYVGNKTEVRIPQRIKNTAVVQIGAGAFRGKNIASVTIPNSIVYIGAWAFADNQLTSITIGAHVSLAAGRNPSFDNGFDAFYNSNGQKAGTYTFSNRRWRFSN